MDLSRLKMLTGRPGLLQAYGVVVGLALSLVMAPPTTSLGAPGAETGDHPPMSPGRDVASNIPAELPSRTESGINCDHINPIRMKVDKLYDGVLPAGTAENPVDLPAMLHSWQAAAAPADGPSASGSTSLAVSLLMCVGMAMMGCLVVA